MKQSLAAKITLGSMLRFTVPTIIMMVFTSLYSIVDGMFAARFIHTDALSAINIVYPIIGITIGLGAMFGSGVSAIAAKKLGEGNKIGARQDFTFITIIAGSISVVVSLTLVLNLAPVLQLLGANEAVYAYCAAYALPMLLFQPMSALQMHLQFAYIADGKPNLGLYTSLAGGAVNMVLDYVFIVPMQMGIAGAALATGIGYCIPAIFGVIYFSRNHTGLLCFVRPRANPGVLVHTMTNGSSEMVTNLSASVTTLMFNLIMMRYLAQDGVAAISIVLYLDFLLIAISLGYSMGVAPLISYNYGSDQRDKLQKIFRYSLLICGTFSVLATTCTVLFARPLVQIFAKPGTNVFNFAVAGLGIYAICYLFKSFNLFSSTMFTAFSNGKVSAILSFARTLVFLVACTLGLTALLGADGVWYAVPLAELLSLIMAAWFIWKLRGRYHYTRR